MENDTLHEKALFFKDRNICVHISLVNQKFYNGIILELSHDFLIIDDEVLGQLPAFYSEISDIEPREPKRSRE